MPVHPRKTAIEFTIKCPARTEKNPCPWVIVFQTSLVTGKITEEEPNVLPLELKPDITRAQITKVRAHLQKAHPELDELPKPKQGVV